MDFPSKPQVKKLNINPIYFYTVVMIYLVDLIKKYTSPDNTIGKQFPQERRQ